MTTKHSAEPRRNGICNDLLEGEIARGLRYECGAIVLPSGKPAVLTKLKNGYSRISLGPSHKRRGFLAARVICWLIHGPPPSRDAQVDHINRDRSDDRPENLRWVTASDNAKNISGESLERLRAAMRRNRVTLSGEAAPWAKLSDRDVVAIRVLFERAMPQSEIARIFGVAQSQISRIVTGNERAAIRKFDKSWKPL